MSKDVLDSRESGNDDLLLWIAHSDFEMALLKEAGCR